jgi:hypothetical protein
LRAMGASEPDRDDSANQLQQAQEGAVVQPE